MTADVETKPVEDLGHKVDDQVSVGEDLAFQEKWWKFENGVWIVFSLLVALDLLGVFGRGWLATTQATSADNSLHVKYERIERTLSPSSMKVDFGPGSAVDGKYRLYVSGSVIQELGNARIAPQPEISAVGDGGYVYTFPATGQPGSVVFSLEPASPGIFHFKLEMPGRPGLERRVVVMP